MPNIFQILGYSIYFWSNEGEPLEPVHFHISKIKGQHTTKVWILSDYSLELDNNNSDIKANELKKIMMILAPLAKDIVKEWEDFFGENASFKK